MLFEKLDKYLKSDLLAKEFKEVCTFITEKNEIRKILVADKDIENRDKLVKQMKEIRNEIYKFLGLD